MNITKLKATALLVLSLLFLPYSAHAVLTVYTSEADFLAAIAGFSDINTLDFESQAAGSTILDGDSIDGITFNYSLPEDLLVDSIFSTTSPSNYLGLDNPDGAFIFGDSFSLTFDQAISAVGLYIIVEEVLFADDFEVFTDAGSAFNSDAPDQFLADGDAYFIGLVEDDPTLAFLTADIISDPFGFGGDFIFNVDDITTAVVPIPPSILLFLSGLSGLLLFRKK